MRRGPLVSVRQEKGAMAKAGRAHRQLQPVASQTASPITGSSPLAPACLSHRCFVCLAAGMAVLGDEDLSLAGDVALADLLNCAHFAAIRLFYAYVDAASLAVPAQTQVVRRHKACIHTLALVQPALSHPPFQSCSRRRPVLPRKAGGRSAEAHRHRRRAAEGGGRAARAAARRRHSSRQHQAG